MSAGEAGREDAGARLAAEEPHLRLLLAHLADSAVRRWIEVDDLVQEVYLRALRVTEPRANRERCARCSRASPATR